jgi:UDP-N-acetylglucosamine acyltransferase
MAVNIHPTAIVSENVKIGENVEIGPYAVIMGDVEIGEGTIVKASSYIDEGTRIGKNCKIGPQAVVGPASQDLKYKGEPCLTIIGDNTTLREFSTVHRGTDATGKTVVGSNCLIMCYSHVAHDCVLGDNVIMSNAAQLAGHVEVGNHVIISGVAKIVQFCKIGDHAFIGADAKIVKDVPNYALVGSKDPVKFDGVNKIGLTRRGFTEEQIREIQRFYKKVLQSGLNTSEGLKEYLAEHEEVIPEIQKAIDFIEGSDKGIYR